MIYLNFGNLMPSPATISSLSCPNCAGSSVQSYSSDCGQPLPKPTDYSVSHFLKEAIHEVFELDGKVVRTLRQLIAAPGSLTLAHWSGRPAPFLTPFRIYLLMTALFFALVPASSSIREQIQGALIQGGAAHSLPESLDWLKCMDSPEFDREFEVRYKALLAVSVS